MTAAPANPVSMARDSPRIRVLKVVTNFSAGGTEGQVHCLAKALDKTKFDLSFACLKKYGRFLEDVERMEIPVDEFQIGKFSQPKTYWQQLRLAKLLRSRKIQVCHSYNFYSNLVAVPAAKLAGVPAVIASIRDRGAYLTPMQRKVQLLTCRLADRVLVNAEAIQDWLIEQGLNREKISLVKNGIDLSLYKKATENAGIRAELGLPETSRLVIMLSRLDPQKGLDDFLRAAAMIKTLHADVHFLIVGDKLDFRDGVIVRDEAYNNYLRALADELGVTDCVTFTGHRTDVPDILTQCDLSVLPSHSEGLSNSLIESMAAGLPIVASNVGGNPELVRHHVNGLLVPAQNVSELAAAIDSILVDAATAEKYGAASRRLCLEQFSTKKMTDAIQQLYASELAKKNPTRIPEQAN